MSLRDWLRTLRRDREQLTVELAEGGVAPESEKRETEERIEAETERRDEHTSPYDSSASQ